MHDIWKCIDCNDFRIHQFNHSFGPFVVLELWNNKNLHVSHNFSIDILYYICQGNHTTANRFIIGYIEEMQKELKRGNLEDMSIYYKMIPLDGDA